MSNPVFNVAERNIENERVYDPSLVMTVDGTIQKAGFLGLILCIAAWFVWNKYALGHTDMGTMLTGAGAIVGFLLALVITFTRNKYLVPVYAACEGLFLGGISATMEASYPGIVSQAIAGTFAALFSMLILYRLKIISCTEKFRSVIFISTLSIAGVYLIDVIGHLFGMSVPVINTSSTFGILFSIVVVAIAALNLIIDFDFVERCSTAMLPKDYEWYGAFGLMVTIVWLYVEILRLIAKLQRR